MEIIRNGSSLFYEKAGNGPTVLLLFHGFGQDHSAFQPLVSNLPACTCYAFDLFFHGNSRWSDTGLPLRQEEWQAFLDDFIEREKIERFSVLGYSIGARLALATVLEYAQQVDKLILVAPDGIGNHPVFTLATGTAPGRWLFRLVAKSPGAFKGLLKLSGVLRLTHRASSRFAASQMNSADRRWKVYHTWTVLRKLTFDKKALANAINESTASVTVILARNDNMVRQKSAERFAGLLKSGSLVFLNCSHQQLLRTLAKEPPLFKDQNDIQR